MHAFAITPGQPLDPARLVDAIVTEEVKHDGRRLFRKGQRLTAADLPALAAIERPVHAVRLAADDLHEDEAGRALADVVAGNNIKIKGPVQSRYNLVAAAKGLLRVDRDGVGAVNRIEGMALFSLPDRLAVVPGKVVAGAKIAPVAVPASAVEAVRTLAGLRPQPIVRVVSFQPLTAAVVATEGLADGLRDRFRQTVERKIGWYGGRVLQIEHRPNDPAAVAAAIEGFIADGAEVVLTAGGNTIDPLDPALVAVNRLGGELVRFGAPAHPGSMFWLAYRGDVPIFNLASCSMYSKATVADLILPWVMVGERVTPDDLADLGYGGLLDRDMGYRFPPYDVDATDEEE
jgi:hypothetical protein